MGTVPLHVGTADGLHTLGGRESPRFEGRNVTALGRGYGRWWCLLEGREIWRTAPDGRWRRAAEVEGLRANCLLPTVGGALVGTSEAHLLQVRRGGLTRDEAFDGMEGRARWFTPWGGPPDVRSMSRSANGDLFVNVHVGGVARSRDRGRSWRPTVDIGADVHQVLAHPRRARLVLAASAVGLGLSRDGGDTWAFETRGFHATYQRAVALAGEVVLVSASRSERGEEAAVYRRALPRDEPFERCARGLPRWFPDNVNTACLAGHGRLAAIGTVDGTVFLSEDRGLTWRSAGEGLPKVTCLAFAQGA